MDGSGIDELRRLVIDDVDLRDRLLASTDFVAAVVEAARERGIDLTADDVDTGLRDARRHRLKRWV